MKKMVIFAVISVILPFYVLAAESEKGSQVMESAATSKYTIGELIDNPEWKAILDRNLPGFSENMQVFLARGMTLRAVQPMAPDKIPVKALDAIDADMAAAANGPKK